MKFTLFGYALMRLIGVLDPILELFAFWRQQLSNLISAGGSLTPEIVHYLADFVFVAVRSGPLS